MHLIVHEVTEAFEPEGGAYSVGGHSHSPEKAHTPVASPATAAALPLPAHVHGPNCNHGHAPALKITQPVAIQIHLRKPHSH